MTWLFTQVWLWSLAAFVIGSLITWLLFVRPLKRRLRAVTEEYSEYLAYAEDRFDSARPAGSPVEHTAMDLLPASPDREPYEEPTAGGWDRAPRPWVAAAEAAPDRDDEPPVGLRDEDYPESVTDTGIKPVDDAELRLEEQREAARKERTLGESAPAESSHWAVTRGETARGDSAQQHATLRNATPDSMQRGSARTGAAQTDSAQTDSLPGRAPQRPEYRAEPVAPPPTAPAELSFTPSEPVDAGPSLAEPENASSQGGWFQKANSDGSQQPFAWASAFDPADAERTDLPSSEGAKLDAEQTGQLRSLFEPRGAPAARPAEPDESENGSTGADRPEEDTAAAAEVDATQQMPKIDEATGLPQRTPGVGPRPGRQNLNSVRQAKQQELAEENTAGADTGDNAGGEALAGVRPGSSEVGSADAPNRESQMVKGHFASRQYHTPDSPQYDRIVAEVWFRSAADAEQAGFEPWDGEQSLN